jgi:hypothetical protein
MSHRIAFGTSAWLLLGLSACGSSGPGSEVPLGKGIDPATAPKVGIDRFSAAAGHLMVRDATNGLPAADTPVNFDQGAPFITQGLAPDGRFVRYYNFDVQPTAPAPIYVLVPHGSTTPLAGQLNIIDVIPGDATYNDFWQIHQVSVPTNLSANRVTSLADIQAAGYPITRTTEIVNCPVVPAGSSAGQRLPGQSANPVQGWYRGKVVTYFSFEMNLRGPSVPTSPIYVTFNVNPDQPGGGPPSGFAVEPGTAQSHNVVGSVPPEGDYSPLWLVTALDHAAFASVHDLVSATAARAVATDIATVNCPIVAID